MLVLSDFGIKWSPKLKWKYEKSYILCLFTSRYLHVLSLSMKVVLIIYEHKSSHVFRLIQILTEPDLVLF